MCQLKSAYAADEGLIFLFSIAATAAPANTSGAAYRKLRDAGLLDFEKGHIEIKPLLNHTSVSAVPISIFA